MEKGLFEVLTEICNEKGISQEVLIDALEAALVAAYKKNFYSAQNVEVSIDRESGTVKVFAKKEVVDLVYDEVEEISLEDARAINGNYHLLVVISVVANQAVGAHSICARAAYGRYRGRI